MHIERQAVIDGVEYFYELSERGSTILFEQDDELRIIYQEDFGEAYRSSIFRFLREDEVALLQRGKSEIPPKNVFSTYGVDYHIQRGSDVHTRFISGFNSCANFHGAPLFLGDFIKQSLSFRGRSMKAYEDLVSYLAFNEERRQELLDAFSRYYAKAEPLGRATVPIEVKGVLAKHFSSRLGEIIIDGFFKVSKIWYVEDFSPFIQHRRVGTRSVCEFGAKPLLKKL